MLPASICRLSEYVFCFISLMISRLRRLHIFKNQICLLPEDFGLLMQLNELDLANNRLSVLPNSFATMTNLHNLNLNNNLFVSHPSQLPINLVLN